MLRRFLTIPNVLATLAVFAAASGTAYAAVTITGAEVQNGSLTGADVKNASLASSDFSRTTASALRIKGDDGADGAPGPEGDVGPAGTKGQTGNVGETGADAPLAYTFQKAARHPRLDDGLPNPDSPIDPSDCIGGDPQGNCPGSTIAVPDGGLRYPRWSFRCLYLGDGQSKHCATNDFSAVRLSRTRYPVMVTSQNASGGLLVLHEPGTIVLNASATFYTQAHSTVQQRLECQLQVARVENGAAQQAVDVGVPSTTYRYLHPSDRNQRERLVTIAASGAIDQPAGTYETQLSCNAPDDTGVDDDRLEFIEGNISVLSTRSNGEA